MRTPDTERAADRLEEAALRHALRLRELGRGSTAETDEVPPEVEASLRELERECLAILNLHEQESTTCRPISVA